VSDELDLLIHRHLDGTLDEDAARRFQERLRSDPEARRRLAQMAYEHALLVESLAAPGRTSSSRVPWLAAALILAALGVALLAGPWRRDEPTTEVVEAPAKGPPKREGFQGFRGRVYARVLERRDKTRVQLRVGEVLATRPSSEAAAPQSLVGVTIGVTLPRLREGEPPGPDRDVAAFLGKLLPGQEVLLELRHVGDHDFAIESLTEEQLEWSRRDERKKAPKEGMKEAPRRDGDREK
jgi:hypothetical protein